jgi:tRNA threonylcarbamoyladenosine biosynthesis protein TsaE
MKELILNKTQTKTFAVNLAKELLEMQTLCLKGDLGAGKTFLSSEMIKFLIDDSDANITSPTFNIVNIYTSKNGKSIYHFDFYRLKNFEELENIGFFDALLNHICIIEWWNVFESELKNYLQKAIFLDILYLSNSKRKFIYVK